jgi:hypothetical protein
MCCCGNPTINGQPGAYSWDGKSFTTRQPAPPALAEGDELLCDEPGRCGGIDAHSHHFRLAKGRHGLAILVRHGGGDERIGLGSAARFGLRALDTPDSDARYWLLHAFYSVDHAAREAASASRDAIWREAAATKRIKTRKLHGRDLVKVWIEPAKPSMTGA